MKLHVTDSYVHCQTQQLSIQAVAPGQQRLITIYGSSAICTRSFLSWDYVHVVAKYHAILAQSQSCCHAGENSISTH